MALEGVNREHPFGNNLFTWTLASAVVITFVALLTLSTFGGLGIAGSHGVHALNCITNNLSYLMISISGATIFAWALFALIYIVVTCIQKHRLDKKTSDTDEFRQTFPISKTFSKYDNVKRPLTLSAGDVYERIKTDLDLRARFEKSNKVFIFQAKEDFQSEHFSLLQKGHHAMITWNKSLNNGEVRRIQTDNFMLNVLPILRSKCQENGYEDYEVELDKI